MELRGLITATELRTEAALAPLSPVFPKSYRNLWGRPTANFVFFSISRVIFLFFLLLLNAKSPNLLSAPQSKYASCWDLDLT